MTAEEERTRLIGDIARVLREGPVPDEARAAALTFIGWLARRMPGEPVSRCDLSRCRGVNHHDERSSSVSSMPPRSSETGYSGPPSGAVARTEYVEEETTAVTGRRPRTAR